MLPYFLLLASLLRLTGLTAPDLWYDEWLSWYRASLPIRDYFIDSYEYTGANLWEILLRPFTYPPSLIRLPALLCGLAALYFAWLIMERLNYTQPQRAAACLALACLPGLIWMAQDARYYAAIGLLYMVAVWAALNNRYGWLFAAAAVSLYIHPTAPAYTVFAPLLLTKPDWKKLLIGGSLTALLWSPRLYQVLFLAKSYGEFWSSPLTLDAFAYEYSQSISVNTLGPWLYLVFLFALLLIGISLPAARKSPETRAALLIATAPLLILIVTSLTLKNVITYRTLQPAALGLCLLAGWVLVRLNAPSVMALILLAAMLVNYDPSAKDGGLQQITSHIRGAWQADDTLVYVTGSAAPFTLYLSDLPACQLEWDNLDVNLNPPEVRHIPRCQLQDLPGRAWLVYPHSPLLSPSLVTFLKFINSAGTSIHLSSEAWQMAPLEVYLLEQP